MDVTAQKDIWTTKGEDVKLCLNHEARKNFLLHFPKSGRGRLRNGFGFGSQFIVHVYLHLTITLWVVPNKTIDVTVSLLIYSTQSVNGTTARKNSVLHDVYNM